MASSDVPQTTFEIQDGEAPTLGRGEFSCWLCGCSWAEVAQSSFLE